MELWTHQHAVTLIPTTVLMFVLAFFLRKWLIGKPMKVRMIPFQIIAAIIVVIEIGKQGLSLSRGYDLYCLPFHFCSLFIFMLPIMAFYKGKYQDRVRGITAALCASVFALMLIYPNLIYGGGSVDGYFKDFMAFHTVTFHNLVMLACLLIPALDLHTPDPKKDVKAILLFILCFCIVSASMAHILKTNYANYYSCNIPVLETVRLAVASFAGEVPAKLLYVTIVSGLNLAFVYGAYWLVVLSCRMNKKAKVNV